MSERGRFAPFVRRGESQGYGAVVELPSQRVYVELVEDARQGERQLAALEVVEHIEEVLAALERFKAAEAMRRPDDADAIGRLVVETFAFFAKKDPRFAEVSFTEASSDDVWFCAFKDGRFFDLDEET